MKALLIMAMLMAGCASHGGYQIPAEVSSPPIFHVGEVWRMDWGCCRVDADGVHPREEVSRIVAIRSDGVLKVQDLTYGTGEWYINPALAIGFQGPLRAVPVPDMPQTVPRPQIWAGP